MKDNECKYCTEECQDANERCAFFSLDQKKVYEFMTASSKSQYYGLYFVVPKKWVHKKFPKFKPEFFTHYLKHQASWKVTQAIYQAALEDQQLFKAENVYSSQQHDDGSIIGVLLTDDDGYYIKVIRDSSEQGNVFKDPIAYRNKKAICYIPELSDDAYTYEDFLALADGSTEVADYLFETVDWQSPSTLFNENVNEGEIDNCPVCNKLYMSYNKPLCDACGKRTIKRDVLEAEISEICSERDKIIAVLTEKNVSQKEENIRHLTALMMCTDDLHDLMYTEMFESSAKSIQVFDLLNLRYLWLAKADQLIGNNRYKIEEEVFRAKAKRIYDIITQEEGKSS